MEFSLVSIVIVLVVLGLAWWLFSTYLLPRIPDPFRTVIIIVLVLACCLWLLSLVGLVGPIRIH